jgi:uncharacterized membrane protein YdbT with pleckstrin-like domain
MPHTVVAVGPSSDPVPLLPGETVIFSVHPHLLPLIFLVTLLLLIGGGISYFLFTTNYLIFLGLPVQYKLIVSTIPTIVVLLVALLLFLGWVNTIYTLTDLRLQWEFGILGKRAKNIGNTDIQAVQVDQGIIGRIFGYGDVITRSAQQPIAIEFSTIGSPGQRAEQIQEQAP